MNQVGDGYENQPADPTSLLNKCREINEGIADIRAKREGQLASAQNALLDSSTGKEDQVSRQTLDYVEDEINNGFRYLRDLLKKIKQTPGSGDSRVQTQVDVTSRNLRREIEQYQRAQSDFQKRLREQVRRRYEIANPEATPEELEQGVDNVLMGQEQSFQVRDICEGSMSLELRSFADMRAFSLLVAGLGKPTMPDKLPSSVRPRFGRLSRI
jgi:syntaxin 1B/2/3